MDRAKIVDFYMNKLEDSDFDIYQVRLELERNNFDEEEIKVIVRLVDNELQRRLLRQTSNSKAINLIWIGAIVAIVGVAITLGTYTGIIQMGNSFLVVYGPLLGGLSILLTGLAAMQKG